jgi:hypothetical protein
MAAASAADRRPGTGPGRARPARPPFLCSAAVFTASGPASSRSGPLCQMRPRPAPRRVHDLHPVAPGAAFTVRRCGRRRATVRRPAYAVRKFAHRNPGTPRSARRVRCQATIVSQGRYTCSYAQLLVLKETYAQIAADMAPVPVGRRAGGAAREGQLCGPEGARGPMVGPVMPPSARLRCGVTAGLRGAGPAVDRRLAVASGWVMPAASGVGTARRHGGPHVVADDGRDGTSSGRRRMC